ncbi:MAG: hypothetical protein ABWY48_02080, partial [Pseudoxanthomonas sp.]
VAKSLGADVDVLEHELYAMKNAVEFVEIPKWIRTLNAWPFKGARLTRREVNAVEIFCIVMAILVFIASFLTPEARANSVRFGAAVAFAAAYVVSVFVRILDAYDLWPSRDVA